VSRWANVTLSIDMDAYDPTRDDATVDVSAAILEMIQTAHENVNVVEHSPEKLIVTFSIPRDFPEIQP
jgi:hypothetical protein